MSAEPSTTIAAPPTPTSSDYLSHSPPYYVAIILGSIAGVTTLAALIAWAFRRHLHAKRRRLADSAAKLPWVYSTSGNGDGGPPGTAVNPDIENGMRNTNTEIGIMNLGSREDMAYVQAWEPRGDRDVGEPKRSEPCLDRKPRPPFIAQQIPSYELFSRHSGREFMSNHAASSCANRISLGSIDPHLQVETLGKGSALLITNQVPGDISACSSQEGPTCGSLSPHSEIGTPRELVPMPRFLGLDGNGLDIPWEEKTLSKNLPSNEGQLQNKTRSRIMSAEHIRKTWDRNAPTSTGDPVIVTGRQEPEGEGWANSIRSNFVNAFNAVAANLPMAAAIKEGKEEDPDRLTPACPKRSSKRRALLRHPDEVKLSTSLNRKDTIISLASDPWSLVETGSNTGVVHVHLPPSDARSISSHETSGSNLVASDSVLDTILRNYEPLDIKKKLSTTPLSKRRSSVLSKDSRSRVAVSRSSSAIGSVSPKRHRKPTSLKRTVTIDRRSTSPLYSRTTSMASVSSTTSALSIVTGSTEDMIKTRLLAREALKDRRRKAKRLKEVSISLG